MDLGAKFVPCPYKQVKSGEYVPLDEEDKIDLDELFENVKNI